MNANDLKIGNYVYFNGKHKEIGLVTGIVQHINGDVIVYLNHRIDVTYSLYKIKAIELNEEWILRFWFEKINDINKAYRLNKYIIELGVLQRSYNFRKVISCEESIMLKEIKYVNELQNIFFSTKGKELEQPKTKEI